MLRMVFVPFIVIELVDGRYFRALLLFVIAGFSDGLDGLLARSNSRSNRGQAFVEHHVSRSLDLAQDSLEVYCPRIQPGYFYSCGKRGIIRNRRTAEFPAQHLRQGEHLFADRSRFLCHAVLSAAGALGLDHQQSFSACNFLFHHHFGFALCLTGTAEASSARTCACSSPR